jgi:hypothetical protein
MLTGIRGLKMNFAKLGRTAQMLLGDSTTTGLLNLPPIPAGVYIGGGMGAFVTPFPRGVCVHIVLASRGVPGRTDNRDIVRVFPGLLTQVMGIMAAHVQNRLTPTLNLSSTFVELINGNTPNPHVLDPDNRGAKDPALVGCLHGTHHFVGGYLLIKNLDDTRSQGLAIAALMSAGYASEVSVAVANAQWCSVGGTTSPNGPDFNDQDRFGFLHTNDLQPFFGGFMSAMQIFDQISPGPLRVHAYSRWVASIASKYGSPLCLLTDPPAVALARLAYENVEPASEVSSLVGLWHQNTITPDLLSTLEDLLLALIESMREHVRSFLRYWDSFSIANQVAGLLGVTDESLFADCRHHLVRAGLLHPSVGPLPHPVASTAARRSPARASADSVTRGGAAIPAAPDLN